MRPLGAPAVTLLVAAAALAGCADESVLDQARASVTGDLHGVVIDPAIRPVANASVRLPALGLEAATNASGEFRFAGLAPGVTAVVVSKTGFVDTALTAEVGGRLVRVQLDPVAGGLPYVNTYVFDGFIECGTAHFAACGAPDRSSEIACQNTGQCLGDVSNDDFDVEYPLDGTPQWVQSEVSWTNTQPLGDQMYLIHFARSEAERTQGGDGRHLGEEVGTSPVKGTVNASAAADAGIGIDSNLVVGVYGGPPSGSPPCPVAASCFVGLVVQQQFRVVTHAFYYYQPAEDWRFSTDGTVPPPPSLLHAR